MCDTPNNNHKKADGSALEHGQLHEQQHKLWSRRSFLMASGLATAGLTFSIGSKPVTALANSPLMNALSNTETDRVLVIVRLAGGNDGLNTIIPLAEYGTYASYRPDIAIPETDVISLGAGEYGLAPTLASFEPLWLDGNMKIAQSVGYPNQSLSHFRSSDIWYSASDANVFDETGWIGRALEQEFPVYSEAPPSLPPAIQIGTSSSQVFRGSDTNMSLVINNPNEFYQIAQTGQLYDTQNLPDCHYGAELGFLREVANSSFRYSEAIKTAFDSSTNSVNYPNTNLAEDLEIVARLIKGNLGTKVYMVTTGGYDTHANQENRHPGLMTTFSEAVKAFYDDLAATSQSSNVAIMSFSEFGRRALQNGSNGTDHGEGSPVFLIGDGIDGNGFFGEEPDLINLVGPGNIPTGLDFRRIYTTLLQDWLCMDPQVVDAVMGQEFDRIPGIVHACTPSIGSNNTAVLLGHQPNPDQAGATLLKYAILTGGVARMQIMNHAGQPLVTLFNAYHEAGSYKISFRPGDYGLPGGQYIYRLDTGGKMYSRQVTALF